MNDNLPPFPPSNQDTVFPGPFANAPSTSMGMVSGMPSTVVTTPPKGKFNFQIIAAIAGLLVLVGGAVAGFLLVRQNQNIEEKAATPQGVATVSVIPPVATLNAGETTQAQVSFDTGGRAITSVSVQLTYQILSSPAFLEVTAVDVNPDLISSGDWSFPVKRATISGKNVNVNISGNFVGSGGFTSSGEVFLATISFKGNSGGLAVLAFDPNQSKIIEAVTKKDVLLTPSSTASYTVVGAAPTPTPEVTTAPEGTATATPTTYYSGVTETPVATEAPEVPVTGISAPTIAVIGLGAVAVLVSLGLAL
jgi:hypothetical protein